MSEVYRYRTIKQILNRKELRDRYFYFSELENLNDPMEGFLNVFWDGDSILWHNLFKHYILCLADLYLQASFSKGNYKITSDYLDIDINDSILYSDFYRSLYNNVYNTILEMDIVKKVLSILIKWKVDKNTLLYYLEIVHPYILETIMDEFAACGMLPNPKLGNLDLVDIFEPSDNLDKERILKLPEPFRIDLAFNRLKNKIEKNETMEIDEPRLMLFYLEFPSMYIDRLMDIIKPKAYMSCFSKVFDNSAMWGHYADNHKGICLIFDEGIGEDLRIGCNEVEGLYDVEYKETMIPINFFLLIRYSDKWLDFWYTHEDNKCFLYDKRYDRQWPIHYASLCKSIFTQKTIDWKSECEVRALILDHQYRYDSTEKRKIYYSKDILKGVILGVNMNEKDKVTLIREVKNNRDKFRVDFKIYQAYFDSSSKIKCHELNWS